MATVYCFVKLRWATPGVMKTWHIAAIFLGYHDTFFFLSRKAAKPQRKTEKNFAALRESLL
jgi:hypothetical protein